jgi:hypothetical protein
VSARYRPIPQRPAARVIIDNDFAGDPDGLTALAHQLLTPRTRTVLITSTSLHPEFGRPEVSGRSAEAGRAAAVEVIGRLGVVEVPVVAGPERFGASPDSESAAAEAIVAEALRDDPLPLFFTCGGTLTNLARALRLEPAIAERLTVVWIGGGAYPEGGWEYNLATDIESARVVVEESSVRLWQVPQNAYRQVPYSIAELTADLRPISLFTEWLYEQFTTPPEWVDLAGAWTQGDSPLVLLTALSIESSSYRDRPRQRILDDCRYGDEIAEETVRVFETLDARLILGDFLALLRLHARNSAPDQRPG